MPDYRVLGPRGGTIIKHATLDRIRKMLPALVVRFGRITVFRNASPQPVTMYDSITPAAIPPKAAAVAGYVNGRWPTFKSLAVMFPKALRLSIAVSSGADADCLDVEPGDATVAQAADWVKRQQAMGAKKPCVYTSVSQAQQLVDTLTRAGIDRAEYRLWTAHYTGKPHLCSKLCFHDFADVADATQYTDSALGRNLDASLCSPHFFDVAV